MKTIEQVEVNLQDLLNGVCVYCAKKAQGNYAIHRDGFGEGPEVPLCDNCGGSQFPSLATIWGRINEN